MESEFAIIEAEYKVKKEALRNSKKDLYTKFQMALKMVSSQFYRDASALQLLDGFKRKYARKKRNPQIQ